MTLKEWLEQRWKSINPEDYWDRFEEWYANINPQQKKYYVKQMLQWKKLLLSS